MQWRYEAWDDEDLDIPNERGSYLDFFPEEEDEVEVINISEGES